VHAVSPPLRLRAVHGFPFVHRERVRFRDLDAMGHVNNAVLATYLEQARIEFLRHAGILTAPTYTSMILARLEIDFRAQGSPDGEVEIGVRAARFGRKSFDLEYEVRQDEHVIASARSVLVAFDYSRNETIEVPEEWRRRLAA
jgi:acyl-CoA thioester hydrolase